MKNKMQKVAAIIFLLIFGGNILFLNAPFRPSTQNLEKIGILLFSTYLVPFELLSILLVASIIGVMYIAGEDKK